MHSGRGHNGKGNMEKKRDGLGRIDCKGENIHGGGKGKDMNGREGRRKGKSHGSCISRRKREKGEGGREERR